MHRTGCFATIIFIGAALLLAGGCTTPGPTLPEATPQAQSRYAAAQELYGSGDYAAAARAFLAVADSDPAIRDRALLSAAASYRSLGQLEQTATWLARIDPHRLAPNDAARYRVLSADVALQRGSPDAALKQLANLPSPLPPEIRQHALDVDARAQLARGNRLAAARALVRRVPLLPAPAQPDAHQQAVAILAGLGSSQLDALYASLGADDPLRPYIQQAMGQSGRGAPRVLPRPNQPVGTLAQGVQQGYAMPASVALLLPASGPVAIAGAAVRDGFFTAYFHATVAAERRPAVRVYDTSGTADGAVAAYQQAVANGARLVVGPLGRAAVSAVFAQPSLPVPVLALNHALDNVPTPSGSFEFALMPEAEGAQLAAHMITLGLHAAIVFRAKDDTAVRTFDAFKTQFASLGGRISSDTVLQPGAVDYASQIQAALGAPAPETGIVTLLRPVQARLLLPQLKLARSSLPVFGTSMVYSGDENPTANGDLDGLQFCDEPWLFDAQAGLPDHATLASQLITANGPAARLFGFGMDAYALLPYLAWLQGHPGDYVPGATGELTMDALGHVQRTLVWVQFQGGVARPLAADLEAPPATAATVPTAP